MSIASEALAEAFSALLCSSGEALTFRGASVNGLVNRNPQSREAGPGKVDFLSRDSSEIQLLKTDLKNEAGEPQPIPRAGEVFTDSFGHYHRVKAAKGVDFKVHVWCDVSA